MTNFEITLRAGIQRWLGYYEKEFTLKKYWGLTLYLRYRQLLQFVIFDYLFLILSTKAVS